MVSNMSTKSRVNRMMKMLIIPPRDWVQLQSYWNILGQLGIWNRAPLGRWVKPPPKDTGSRPTRVMTRIPMRMAPFTRLATSTAMRNRPTTLQKAGVRCP